MKEFNPLSYLYGYPWYLDLKMESRKLKKNTTRPRPTRQMTENTQKKLMEEKFIQKCILYQMDIISNGKTLMSSKMKAVVLHSTSRIIKIKVV